MLLKGEALIGTFTLGFTISGNRTDGWKVAVSAPGSGVSECESDGATPPYILLHEMLQDAVESASHQKVAMR